MELTPSDRCRADRLRAALSATQRQTAGLRREHAELIGAAEAANGDDEHDPEGATIAFEREQVAALIAHSARRGREIEAALRRLEAGAYGQCTGCGLPIAAERLAARPQSHTCVSCAARPAC